MSRPHSHVHLFLALPHSAPTRKPSVVLHRARTPAPDA
eukprot:CAMPEP_0114121068 /NCGR_PEP_ID=MMETSP0043_2-20121206/6986_1 /TAXON_ID=464988 /ORGANISM="Hemiselmis andersenii, Strain CCMP644" /LENGTH=37 /DNA_ID= /DNA_START= /DNA_END= /DNA_ORIENTATION=